MECLQVIAALQSRHHPVHRMYFGHSRRQPAEVVRPELKLRERVIDVGIEPGADEHPVGFELLHRRNHQFPPRPAVNIARGTRRHRDVDGGALCLTCIDVLDMAVKRIERILVDRHVQHTRVVTEHRLGSVSVMGVPVENRHPLPLGTEQGRRYGDVVEKTEPHGPLAKSVVAWGSRDRETGCVGPGPQLLDERPHTPSRGQGSQP